MKDSFEYEGNIYELPKKTLKIAKGIDDVYSSTTSEQAYRRQYTFVCDILGKDVANEMLDGKTIETIDLVETTVLFKLIENAYLRRVAELTREQDEENIDTPAVRRIIEVGEAVREMTKVAK